MLRGQVYAVARWAWRQSRNLVGYQSSREFRGHMQADAVQKPRNMMVIASIIAVFALFSVYEFARFTEYENQKRSLIAKVMDIRAQKAAASSAERTSIMYIPEPAAMQAAVLDFAEQDGAMAQMVPHFLVVGSVMMVILLLVWQRRTSPRVVSGWVTPQVRIQEVEARLRKEQRDMSQKLLEEKFRAEAASRAKTSFLAHLSHDVRTPLNHIIGFADLIAHQTYGPLGDNRYLSYINDIKCSGERLLGSFTEILTLAQIEGGQLELRREQLRVEKVMNAVAKRFEETARRAGLHFDVSLPEGVILYGDRICVERMLGNIVENAIQFTPSGGRVMMAGWAADDGVVIEISDTGIGISEERLKDLAQPFALSDAAFTRETNGVGLGIAISRAIAELSGGMMEIDSNPAVGTTVAICLPRQQAQSNVQAA